MQELKSQSSAAVDTVQIPTQKRSSTGKKASNHSWDKGPWFDGKKASNHNVDEDQRAAKSNVFDGSHIFDGSNVFDGINTNDVTSASNGKIGYTFPVTAARIADIDDCLAVFSAAPGLY